MSNKIDHQSESVIIRRLTVCFFIHDSVVRYMQILPLDPRAADIFTSFKELVFFFQRVEGMKG
ncbi:hypothetical protein J2Y45_003883 [Dyadobacter sp. BE34]|uniref:Uncharacterized protein n=1 Tax=Dyadobacter fermentans TaxID=94254 RepID=A0ABU1QZV4_9BACT|nr:hypothetical protein [Dyadobacter fermentans]MDR7044433.1 hypothetical protein [Dyadobacter sp. BE242]MDR7198743.1 hypothetical protein [Dyadobacter sp. BE34]MDR7216705.1 hypothetical protein [Dyadobacter sp. BE31]MDR7263769.1 hypothetical protein [Dyadobacter sp. BE32]